MNHRRCYQDAPLLVGRGPIHGESTSTSADTAGWDAAPISISLGGLIHRESTERRRRFLIHRESDMGEDKHSACPWNASGLRGVRDCSGNLIHRESPIGEARRGGYRAHRGGHGHTPGMPGTRSQKRGYGDPWLSHAAASQAYRFTVDRLFCISTTPHPTTPRRCRRVHPPRH